jgi:hypothetical protein
MGRDGLTHPQRIGPGGAASSLASKSNWSDWYPPAWPVRKCASICISSQKLLTVGDVVMHGASANTLINNNTQSEGLFVWTEIRKSGRRQWCMILLLILILLVFLPAFYAQQRMMLAL